MSPSDVQGTPTITRVGDDYVCGKCGQRSPTYIGFWELPDEAYDATGLLIETHPAARTGFVYSCTQGDDIECRQCGNEFHMDCSIFERDVKAGRVTFLGKGSP